MAWTGTINSFNKRDGKVIANVTISGTNGIYTRDLMIDFFVGTGTVADYVAWIKRQAIQWAAQIDAVYGFADAITTPVSVDFTPDVIVPPDAAYVAFVAQVLLLRRLNAAVKSGAIPASTAQYTTAQANVLAGLTANPGWVTALDGLSA